MHMILNIKIEDIYCYLQQDCNNLNFGNFIIDNLELIK